MDPSGDGVGGLTATGLFCGSCGAQSSPTAKFCGECGRRLTQATQSAEYKQVTVLFADVVHSMDIAAAVGAERLREIMAELVNRAGSVVQHFGGTVDKFTGDGVMAVFGAPVALEDHAIRACLAALGIQGEIAGLAAEVSDHDGVELAVRVGLNSGRVIAGEVGSRSLGYTTIGEQVGMAQRMESVAPPGGVMLSDSTARLVERAAVLGEPELVSIKGCDEPVTAHRLLGVAADHESTGLAPPTLVGRDVELHTISGMLDRSVSSQGCVIGVAGPAGIGKSRLVGETVALAKSRGVEVFLAFCESHTREIPFHVAARLLRAVGGITDLDDEAARARVHAQVPDADAEDVVLLFDLLGIRDPDVALPNIDPDARRRRLSALINSVSLARTAPAVYIIEDAHWIDEVSESMFADFLTVIPQTHSTVLITYRPEYEGALTRIPGAQTIALAPLSDSESSALLDELLGPDPSVVAVRAPIAGRAAGNPFFAQEIVRELAERGVLHGDHGAYGCRTDVAEVTVPASLQATIAARIDRLPPQAKSTLSAAAVIGSRFGLDLLTVLGVEPVVADLAAAQLIDQVKFTRQPEFVFHHPLIRAVAYEAQLKSDRAELHRRLAAAIQEREPESADENAALIAKHLEAAGDLRAAFAWHMRAGAWANYRDIRAARTSWQHARRIADGLATDPATASMRITSRALLCATAWRVGGNLVDTGFDDLRELCATAGDTASLALGTAGQLLALTLHHRYRESSRLAAEFAGLIERIDDPTMRVRVLPQVIVAQYEAGAVVEALQLSERVIDLAEGEAVRQNLVYRTALARATMMRGLCRCALGRAGWRTDLDEAITMARGLDPGSRFLVITYIYGITVANKVLLPDTAVMRGTSEALEIAARSGQDFALVTARWVRGLVLCHGGDLHRAVGLDLLVAARQTALQQGYPTAAVPVFDIEAAREKLRLGDIDGAVKTSREAFDYLMDNGGMLWHGSAITVLVEALLARGGESDLREAQDAIDRLDGVPTDPGFVFHALAVLRLRALLATARGDDVSYRDYRDRYRALATSLGFEGHMKWAEAMP